MGFFKSKPPAVDLSIEAELDQLRTNNAKLRAENASLEESVSQAAIVIQRKLDLIADLGNQNEELRKAKPMSAAEREDLDRHLAEGRKAIASWSKIAEWLGEWKRDEISQGKHLGMSDAEVVIMYMSRSLDKP